MASCLFDVIGFDTDNGNGLTLIGLPGISIDNFDAIVDKNDTSSSLWDNIQNRAIRKFHIAALSRLNECYKITDTNVVECLIAENKDVFLTAFWYLLGAETMIERIYSDRLNRFTSIDIEEAKELLAFYQSEYEKELMQAVRGINPSASNCITDCLDCNSSSNWVEATL